MRRLAVLVLALLVAGCSGPSDDQADAGSGAGSDDLPATPAVPAPPPPPAVHVATCTGTSGATVGLSPSTTSTQGPVICGFSEALAGNLSHIASAVVEVVWVPAPGTTGASALLQSSSCYWGTAIGLGGVEQHQCDHGTGAASSSPLRLDVDAAVFQEYGHDNLTVLVAPQGVSAAQAFTIYVTLFEGLQPPAYTAIPA